MILKAKKKYIITLSYYYRTIGFRGKWKPVSGKRVVWWSGASLESVVSEHS